MGITVLIARYIGEKSTGQIGQLLGGAVTVFAIVSAVLFVVMVFFAKPLAVLMQAPQEAISLTTVYVRICGGGIFFIVAYNVLAAIFRGLGDSRSPLIFVAVACVVNIIGDLILVAGFHLDAAGAAIATVAAQAVSVVLAIVLLKKKDLKFGIQKKDFRINGQCKRFLKVGLPLALQEFLTQMSFLALCAFEAPFVITTGANGTGTYFVIMNKIAHTSQKVGLASAMSVVLLMIIFICTILQNVFFKYVFRDAASEDESYKAKKARLKAEKQVIKQIKKQEKMKKGAAK